jgi:hypothetical protein
MHFSLYQRIFSALKPQFSAKRILFLALLAIFVVTLSGTTVLVLNAVYDIPETAAPANPASGFERYYADSTTHKFSCVTSSGTSCAPSGGGGSFSVNGFYLNDGTNNYVGPINQIATLPSAGNYSWVNQGSATETASGNALILHGPPAGSASTPAWALRTASISSNTTLVVAVIGSQTINEQGSSTNITWGVGFRESATGKLVTLAPTEGIVQVNEWSSPTAFSNNVFNSNAVSGMLVNIWWVKLTFTGGNISFSYSMDGVNFPVGYTQAQNAFFTTAPDQWFYAVNGQDSVQDVYATLLSWKAAP